MLYIIISYHGAFIITCKWEQADVKDPILITRLICITPALHISCETWNKTVLHLISQPLYHRPVNHYSTGTRSNAVIQPRQLTARFVIVMTNLDTPPTPTRAGKVRNCPLSASARGALSSKMLPHFFLLIRERFSFNVYCIRIENQSAF